MTLISKSSALNTQKTTLTINQHTKQTESMTSQKLKHSSTIKVSNMINNALKNYLTRLSLLIIIFIFFFTEV